MKNSGKYSLRTVSCFYDQRLYIFFILMIVSNALVAAAASNYVAPSHQNIVDPKSDDAPARADRSPKSHSDDQLRKKMHLKLYLACTPELNILFHGKIKQKHCPRRTKPHSRGSPPGAGEFHDEWQMQSKVPHWINLARMKYREKSALRNSTFHSAAHSNATSASTSTDSRVAPVNSSAPEEGKGEEKKLSMNLEKVRMDVLGRMEEEQQLAQQQQQQQQQQPVQGSANRSSSIPLIHRSTEETLNKGVNYASAALGAKIVSSNAEGKHSSALLSAEEERYWMSPCSANRSVVIELAENVLVKSITLAHNEYYSSISRAVLLQGAQILPTDKCLPGSFRTTAPFPTNLNNSPAL
jgi:hypothetical protein